MGYGAMGPRKAKGVFTHRVTISLTDDEHQVFSAYARSQDKSMAALARSAMRAEVKKRGGQGWYRKILPGDATIADVQQIVKDATKRQNVDSVYFICDHDAKLIKIGWSYNVDRRLHDISSTNPHPLELLFCIRGDQKTESAIHQRFAAIRRQNEWFLDCPELREFIEALKKGVGSVL